MRSDNYVRATYWLVMMDLSSWFEYRKGSNTVKWSEYRESVRIQRNGGNRVKEIEGSERVAIEGPITTTS